MAHNGILTPRAIERLIAAGKTIVIKDGRVLQLDGWLDKHPGGRLAILHMVGRDATDEINVYHSTAALQMMNRYSIGRTAGPWASMTPPIRGGIYCEDSRLLDESLMDSHNTDTESSDDWSSCMGSLNSSSTSLNSLIDASASKLAPISGVTVGSLEGSSLSVLPVESASRNLRSRPRPQSAMHESSEIGQEARGHVSPKDYTSSAVQKLIDDDVRDYPSLDIETQRSITLKYQALHQRVKAEGFYDCRYLEYGKEVIRYLALFMAFILCLRGGWYLTSACFLGLFWHQIMFTAHDAGHRGITHNFIADTLIGIFIADFCCGLSIGWWKSSHNVHHLVTNHPEHDPDIQNVPLFATCPSFFRSLHSTYYNFTYKWDAFANLATKYQAYTYYPVMGIARFNLYLLSWLHLISSRSTNLGCAAWTRPAEILAMLCYWFLFGYCLLYRSIPTIPLRIAFVLVSHTITMPLHVQITLSHWAMPTADLGATESFPQRQLRTTMDVDCPAWLDFLHGGLQFQAVHHLFPRVPRHNLRRLQVLVRAFCVDTGIEYKCFGFVEGNRKVLGRLGEVANQVEMLVQCQKYMAKTGDSGLS